MPRIQETTVYQFDELSERAKERARDWYREDIGQDTDWAESVIEDAARIGKILGIDFRTRPVKLMGGGTRYEPDIHWAVDSRGDDVSVSGRYAYVKGSIKAIAAECPAWWIDRETGARKENQSNATINKIAAELRDIQRKHFYRLTADLSHSHNRSITQEVTVYDASGDYADESVADDLADVLKDFSFWIKASLEAEWEYRYSDECVDENIRSNEYEFTEDGERA